MFVKADIIVKTGHFVRTGETWVVRCGLTNAYVLKHTGTYTYDAQGQDATYKALHAELSNGNSALINTVTNFEVNDSIPPQQAELPPERRSAKILAKTQGKKKKKKAS